MGWQEGFPAVVVVSGSPAGFFIYSPTPGAGNLIGSWASQGGVDAYGNGYPQGIFVAAGEIEGPVNIQVGQPAGSQISLMPTISTPVSLAQLITGIIQAAAEISTTDTNETIAAILGSVLLSTISGSTKMTTVLTSPLGANTGIGVLLEAENDASTDQPCITFVSITTPDDVTEVFTPLVAIQPTAIIIYNATGGNVVVTKTSGASTITTSASGISPGKGEAWGAGASTAGVSAGANTALGGNGSGGYSCEPAFVFTPGGTVSYSVAASANSPGGSPPDTTLTGNTQTVTAHAGQAGTGASLGAGAPASTNTIAIPGASGGARSTHLPQAGGGGGGGGSGPSGQGNHGNGGSPTAGGAGGFGSAGSGNGGNGGAPNTNGSAGASPGGGGGGGGSDADGAIGGHGQVKLTYSIGTPGIFASIATAAGTDQFGNTFEPGIALGEVNGSQKVPFINWLTADAPQCSSTSPTNTGLSVTVPPGTYWLEADLITTVQAANDMYLWFGGTAVESVFNAWIKYEQVFAAVAGDAEHNTRNETSFGVNTGLNSAGLTVGNDYWVHIQGYVTVTTGGTIVVSQAASANAATFTVKAGSVLKVYQ